MSLGPQFSGDRQQAVNLPDPVVLQVVDPNHPIYDPIYAPPASTFGLKRTLLLTTAFSLAVGLLGIAGLIITKNQSDLAVNQKDTYATSAIPLSEVTPESILGLAQLGKLDINGRVQVNGALVLTPQEQPTDVTPGTIYYDKTTNQVYYYNGQDYRQVADTTNTITSLAGQTGAIALGQGLSLANGILSSSINPQDLDLTLTAGTGIAVTNGTTITNTGVTGISSQTGNIALGRGLTMSGNTLTSTTTLVSSNPGVLVVTEPTPGNYSIGFAGAGLSGTVQLGPVSAQIDSAATPSLFVNKTTPGELLHFQNNGVDAFTVSQTGVITNGSIAYSQVSGAPLTTVTGIDAASGAITLGSGLLMTGNVLSVNIAGPSGNYIDDDTVQQTANFNIRSGNAGWVTSTISGTTAQAVNILEVRATGTANPLFSVGPAGTALFQPSANSLSSFRIYNSDASKLIFNIDSTNGRVGIGTATPAYDLDVIGDINASNSILVGGSPVCTTSGCLTQAQAGQFVANTYQLTPSHPENLALITGFNTQPTATLQAASGQTSNLLQLQDTSGNKTLAISTSGSIDFYNTAGTFKGSIVFQTPIANATYTIPADATGGEFCILELANCSGTGTGLTGSGTGGVIPVFTGASSVANSVLTQSANTITLAGDLTVTQAGGITIGTPSSVNGLLRLANSTNGNLTTIQPLASAPSGTIDLRLPNTSGTLAVGVVNGGALSYDPTTGLIDCIGCVTTGGGSGASGVDSVNARTGAVVFDNTTFVGLTGKLTIDDASTTQKGIAQFNSTNFSSALGVVNTIQNINSTATPTFSTLSLTGSNTLALGTSSTATGSVVFRNNANANTLSLVPAATTGGNKTITLPDNSGTVAVAGSGNINLSANGTLSLTGQVPVSGGGTGIGTFATNGILFGNGTGAIGATAAAGGAGQCLISTAGAPIWSSCAGAGTGVSLQAAYANSTPATIDLNNTNGGLTVRDNATPITGNLFGVQSSGGGTTYLSVTTGGTTIRNSLTLSSISTTGVLQTNASGLVSSSRLNLADTVNLVTGTVGVGSGGTGGTSFTQYGALYGDGGNPFNATNAGTAGNCLVSNGGSSAPIWSTCAGTGSGINLQATYDNSAPAAMVLSAANGGIQVRDDSTPLGGTLFAVQSNGGATNYLRVTASGTTIGSPLTASNLSTGAVQSNGSGLLSSSRVNLADTTNLVMGTVDVPSGGTGANSFTQYAVVYGNNTGAFGSSNVGSLGNCFISYGGVSAPAWDTCAGAGSGVTLQAAYDNSSPARLTLTGANGGLLVRDNAAPIGTSLLAVQNSTGATSYLSVTPTATTLNGNLVVQGTGTITAISQTLTGASSLTLGTTGTNNGSVIFRSSTAASGTITLQGPASKNGTNQVITFSDSTGEVCVDNAGVSNCVPITNSNLYIQNQNLIAQMSDDLVTPVNFRISVTGRSAALQAGSLDRASAGTLTLAGTNATAVTIGKTTTLSSGAGFTAVAGNTSLTGDSSGTALTVNNSTSIGNVAEFRDNSTNVLTVADGGGITIRNTVNNVSGFNLQKSDSTNLFKFDSVNTALYVNKDTDTLPQTWVSTSVLPASKNFGGKEHVTSYNGYIYSSEQFGNYNGQIYSAPVDPLIGTGAWTTAGPIVANGDVYWKASLTAYNGYLYSIGGTGYSVHAQVYRAQITGGGTHGAWSAMSSLPDFRYDHTTIAHNNYMYVIGGIGSGFAQKDTVYYAVINGDGTLGAWNSTSSIPEIRSKHDAVVLNGYMYVIGGTSDDVDAKDTVYYAPINGDGTLGSWNTTTSMPAVRNNVTVQVYNGQLYAIGGNDAAGLKQSTIYVGSVDVTGAVTGWTTSSIILPAAAGFDSSVASGDQAIVVGSKLHLLYISGSKSYYRSLSPPPPPQNVFVNGSLDLVGGSSSSLTAGSNSGNLLAGNTKIVGELSVLTNTGLTSALSVGNTVSVATVSDGESFTIQSSQSTRWMSANTANNTLSLGNSSTNTSWTKYSPVSTITASIYSPTIQTNSTYGGLQSVYYNGNIYSVGSDTINGASVVRAKLNTDGTINPIVIEANMPDNPTHFLNYKTSLTELNGKLYLISGCFYFCTTVEVSYSTIQPDGSLGVWSFANSLPDHRHDHKSLGYNGHIYVLGGKDYFDTYSTTIYSAAQQGSGALDAWQVQANNLPIALAEHQAVVFNDKLIVFGGKITGGAANYTIYMATIAGNGSIGAWSIAGTTDRPILGAGVQQQGNYAVVSYLTGINYTTTKIAAINVAQISAGQGASIIDMHTLPGGDNHRGAFAIANNYFYSLAFTGPSKNQVVGYSKPHSVSLSLGTNINIYSSDIVAGGAYLQGKTSINKDVNIVGKLTSNSLNISSFTDGQIFKVQSSSAKAVLTLDSAANSLTVFGDESSVSSFKSGEELKTVQGRAGFATATYGSYLYVIGGHKEGSGSQSSVLYSTQGQYGQPNSYKTTTSLPDAIYGATAHVIGTRLFVIGGNSSGRTYYATINSDGSLGAWSIASFTIGTAPIHHSSFVHTVSGTSYFVVLGGQTYFGSTNQSAAYKATIDLTTGNLSSNWSSAGATIFGYQDGGVIRESDTSSRFFTVGGASNTTGSCSTWVVRYNIDNGANITLDNTTALLPSAKCGHKVIYRDGAWYAVGGFSNSATYYSTNVASGNPTWSTATVGVVGVSGRAGVVESYSYPNRFSVIGGTNNTSNASFNNTMYGYDTHPGTKDVYNSASQGSHMIPESTFYHSSVALNGYIYSIGNFANTSDGSLVSYASVDLSGAMSTWAQTTNLPVELYNSATVAYKGYVYVIGGTNVASTDVATIYYAKQNSDGTLGSWQVSANSLPFTASRHEVVLIENRMYIIGGYRNGNITSNLTAYSAIIGSDGITSGWASTGSNVPYAGGLIYFSAVADGNVIYIIGGFGSTSYNTVYRATATNGTLTGWTAVTSLPAVSYAHEALVYAGQIYVFAAAGGVNNYYAKITNINGNISSWTTTTPFSSSRGYGAAVEENGYAYLIGGSTPTTLYANFPRTIVNGTLDLLGNISSTANEYESLPKLVVGSAKIIGDLKIESNLISKLSASINDIAVINVVGDGDAINVLKADGAKWLSANTLTNELRVNVPNTYTISGWAATTSLPGLLSDAKVVTNNGYAYLFTSSTLVYYAKLGADGSVSSWSLVSSLPAGYTSSAVVRYKNFIYVISGNGSTNTYFTRIKGDGSLAAWQATTAPPAAVYDAGATVNNGRIYLVGGTVGGVASNQAIYAQIQVDGSIGTWQTSANTLPANLTGNGLIAVKGNLYSVAGENAGTPSSAIYHASFASNGDINAWTTSGVNIGFPRAQHTIDYFGGKIVITGGVWGSFPLNFESSISLNSDGTINSVGGGNGIPVSVYNHASVVSGGRMYIFGGFDGTSGTSAVYSGALPRTQINGALDLVGGSGGNLTDNNGSGELIAGNTQVVGELTVTSTATIANGLSVTDGGLNVFNDAATGYATTIRNVNTGTDADGLLIDLGVDNASRTTSNYFIGFSGIDFAEQKPLSSKTTSFWFSSTYNAGYRFTPNVNGQITQLGANTDAGTYTVRLYRYSDGVELASTSVTVATNGVWSYSNLVSAVNITSGQSYVVAVYTFPNYQVSSSATPFAATSNITINEGLYGTTTGMPNTTYASIFGAADITFVPSSGNGTIAGKIQGGASTVAYTTSGADYAEYFKAPIGTGMPTSGELVALDPTTNQGVVRATATGGTSTLPLTGIVSTSPGFIGNGPVCNVDDNDCDTNYAKYNALVALSGQVPTKVNTSNGPIAIGDPITISTTPGQGAKATTNGYIVGYAMEPLTTGSATIKVLVRPESYNQTNTNPSLNSLQGSDLTITGSTNLQGDVTIGANLNVTGAVTLSSLTVTGNTTITGNLTVQSITTTNLIVNGHIVSGGNTPTVNVGTAAGQGATATITGTDTAGTITVTTGTSNLTAGELVRITFASPYTKAPIVSLTAGNSTAAQKVYYLDVLGSDETGYLIRTPGGLSASSQYVITYKVIR